MQPQLLAHSLRALLRGPSALKCASSSSVLCCRALSSGPTTATPPPDTARGATADLADVFIPEPVDQVAQRSVQIMEPIFK